MTPGAFLRTVTRLLSTLTAAQMAISTKIVRSRNGTGGVQRDARGHERAPVHMER